MSKYTYNYFVPISIVVVAHNKEVMVVAETVTDIIKHFEKLEESVMYRYEYETVSCELGGWGFGSGNIYSIGDYQSVINKRAEEGWRYVGCIPIKQRGTGHTQEMDLIFEKEV